MTAKLSIGRLTLRQVLGTLYFLGIAMLATVILLWVGGHLRAQAREELLADGQKVAERLARDSRIALIQHAPENVLSAVEMARGFPNVEAVAIYTSHGEPFVASLPPDLAPAEPWAVEVSNEGARLVKEDAQRLVIAAPVIVDTAVQGNDPFGTALGAADPAPAPGDRRLLGRVFLTLDKTATDSAIGSLERHLLVWMLLVATGVLVAIILVMTWVTQPFRRLAAVMTDPQTAQRYTTAPVYGLREAREMAASFNALIAAFAAVQGELVSVNEALEARVRERTQALTEANAAKSRFLSRMSHEIRTPLHGVITSADLLRTTTEISGTQLPYLQAIHHSAQLLLGVIDGVLDWAKIDAGKVELETTDFDLQGVLQRVVMVLSRQAEAKGLRLHFDIAPDTPHLLRGDPTRLSQVLMNLAGNAVKFTDQGSVQLTVSASQQSATEVTLRGEVTDTGIGIPAAAQTRIFDYFAQADESIGRHYGGSGLGTAIAKFLVELMGGRIGVQSDLGKGSCFWFEVPLRKQARSAGDAPREGQDQRVIAPALQRLGPPVRPLRILVAEDNPTNQFVIRQLLTAAGHLPRIVADGCQALQALESEAFDLALIDMHMPRLDGPAAVARYRQQRPDSDLPIVMLTADATPTATALAYAAGVTAHLTKPVAVEGLLELLERLTRQRSRGPLAPAREPLTAPDALQGESEPRVLRLDRLEQIRHQVRAPDLVAKLVATYRRDAQCGVENLERGLANGDWETVRDAAHGLRGAASAVGAEQVMRVCEHIERAAGQQQAPALRRSAALLRAAVAAVTAALDDYAGNEAREPGNPRQAAERDYSN